MSMSNCNNCKSDTKTNTDGDCRYCGEQKITISDDREKIFTAVPYLKVNKMQEHAYHGNGQHYCVMQKMVVPETGEYAGWKHVSDEFETIEEAFAEMGRLTQHYISLMHRYLPVEQR